MDLELVLRVVAAALDLLTSALCFMSEASAARRKQKGRQDNP